MLMKRFRARTLAEALDQARAACGEDALLIETRQTGSGYLIVAARPGDALDTEVEYAEEDRRPRWTRGFAPLAGRALGFGISSTILRAVENALVGTRVCLDRPGDPALENVASRILQSLIKTQAMDLPEHRVTAFVGATGVGKTTTLAKLAAGAVRDRGEEVAIVTVDTYRVAAVEQLRAFADMLRVPFVVAFTPQDVRRAVQEHAGADRILIDTSGRSPFDQRAIAAMKNLLDPAEPAHALCLGAHSRRADARAVMSAFAPFAPSCAILTKWDETAEPGEALSLAVERGLPLSHVTIGQEVPDDIVVADAHALAVHALGLAPCPEVISA